MTNSTPRNLLAHTGLFYAAAIWGTTFVMVKSALGDIDPVILVAYRFLIAGTALLGFLLVKRRPLTRDLGKGVFLGIVIWLLYVPQTIGLGITSASNSGFITGLFVVFVPLFLRTIVHRKPNHWEITASIVALAGLGVLTGGLQQMNTGDALTLLAAMTYALHLLYSDKYMKTGIDPITISCQQFLVVGLLSLTIGLVFDLPLSVGSRGTMGTVVFLALFPTLSAFVIQMFAQRVISPLRVSLVFAFEPVFAGLFAWTYGGEEFAVRGAVGGLLIFSALVLSGLPATPRD